MLEVPSYSQRGAEVGAVHSAFADAGSDGAPVLSMVFGGQRAIVPKSLADSHALFLLPVAGEITWGFVCLFVPVVISRLAAPPPSIQTQIHEATPSPPPGLTTVSFLRSQGPQPGCRLPYTFYSLLMSSL